MVRTPLKFKKLHPDAVLPEYANRGDACFDLVATSIEVLGIDYYSYGTGLAIEIPEGYVGIIVPRSSASNKGITLAHNVGIIDSGYRGELTVRYRGISPSHFLYAVGERIAQMMLLSVQQWAPQFVKELSETERGTGGYGSTGK